jgi:hypothetical protein
MSCVVLAIGLAIVTSPDSIPTNSDIKQTNQFNKNSQAVMFFLLSSLINLLPQLGHDNDG